VAVVLPALNCTTEPKIQYDHNQDERKKNRLAPCIKYQAKKHQRVFAKPAQQKKRKEKRQKIEQKNDAAKNHRRSTDAATAAFTAAAATPTRKAWSERRFFYRHRSSDLAENAEVSSKWQWHL
jgi:hypothetical protein